MVPRGTTAGKDTAACPGPRLMRWSRAAGEGAGRARGPRPLGSRAQSCGGPGPPRASCGARAQGLSGATGKSSPGPVPAGSHSAAPAMPGPAELVLPGEMCGGAACAGIALCPHSTVAHHWQDLDSQVSGKPGGPHLHRWRVTVEVGILVPRPQVGPSTQQALQRGSRLALHGLRCCVTRYLLMSVSWGSRLWPGFLSVSPCTACCLEAGGRGLKGCLAHRVQGTCPVRGPGLAVSPR